MKGFFKPKKGDIIIYYFEKYNEVGLYVADEAFGPGSISVAFGSTFSESLWEIGDLMSTDTFFKMEE